MNSLCILDEKLLPAVTGGPQRWEKNVETPKVVDNKRVTRTQYAHPIAKKVCKGLPCLSKSSINRHLRSTEREGGREGEKGGRERKEEGKGGRKGEEGGNKWRKSSYLEK